MISKHCVQAIKEEIDEMLHLSSSTKSVRQTPTPRQASFSESLHDYMVTRASSSFEQLG